MCICIYVKREGKSKGSAAKGDTQDQLDSLLYLNDIRMGRVTADIRVFSASVIG